MELDYHETIYHPKTFPSAIVLTGMPIYTFQYFLMISAFRKNQNEIVPDHRLVKSLLLWIVMGLVRSNIPNFFCCGG